jgi:hypothetical protein
MLSTRYSNLARITSRIGIECLGLACGVHETNHVGKTNHLKGQAFELLVHEMSFGLFRLFHLFAPVLFHALVLNQILGSWPFRRYAGWSSFENGERLYEIVHHIQVLL